MVLPPNDWQQQIHYELSNQSSTTAFHDLCTVAIPWLDTFLKSKFPSIPADDRNDVIVDLLYNYLQNPQQFDPEKLSLFAYLRMAAKRDMLNILAKQNRHQKHVSYSLDDPDVEDRLWDGNIGIEDQIEIKLTAEIIIAGMQLGEVDRAVLTLMIAGERATASYAEVMGLADADEVTQLREVKRMKDKLNKRLQRLRQDKE